MSPKLRIVVDTNVIINAFLALAVDGEADAIVTGDRDLLALHPYAPIAILSPRDFLKRWGSAPSV